MILDQPNRSLYSLPVEAKLTVLELKRLIGQIEGIDTTQYQLFIEDTLLADMDKLSTYSRPVHPVSPLIIQLRKCSRSFALIVVLIIIIIHCCLLSLSLSLSISLSVSLSVSHTHQHLCLRSTMCRTHLLASAVPSISR